MMPANHLTPAIQLVGFWICSNYLFVGPERSSGGRGSLCRILLSALGPILILTFGVASLVLAAFGALLSTALVRWGDYAARRTMSGEYELLVLSSYVGAAYFTSANLVFDPRVILPISEWALASSVLGLTAIVLLADGGSLIVRGLLDKVGSVPTPMASGPREFGFIARSESAAEEWLVFGAELQAATASESDGTAIEAGRGRIIGFLERWLVFFLAVVGSYGAVGFIVAAKGVVRAKEFENRDFAEYFLIGTLTSIAFALGVAAAVRTTLASY